MSNFRALYYISKCLIPLKGIFFWLRKRTKYEVSRFKCNFQNVITSLCLNKENRPYCKLMEPNPCAFNPFVSSLFLIAKSMNIFSSNFSLLSCDSWNSTCSYLSMSTFLHFKFSLDNFICAHSLIKHPNFHLRASDAVFRFTRGHRLPEGCKEFHTTYWLNNRLPELIKKKKTRYLIPNCSFQSKSTSQKQKALFWPSEFE